MELLANSDFLHSISPSFYRSVDWRRVLRRVVKEIQRDDVFGRAAQMSYFLVFSLVPALLMLTVVLGYVAQGEEMRTVLLNYLGQFAPGRGFELIRDILEQVSADPSGGKLSLGLVTTLWAASSGINSVIDGLNKAYEIREQRPWWKTRALALAMTVGISFLITTALVVLVYGRQMGTALAEWFNYGEGFQRFWAVVRWPSVILFVFVGLLILYRFGPNIEVQRWRWIVPGAAFALALWLLVSFGLQLYLRHFPTFGAVYGALGAVLVLLLWLYLTSAAVLIGGELNSEIENSAAARGDRDAKRPGEKTPAASRHPRRSDLNVSSGRDEHRP
jgi:membrane protein